MISEAKVYPAILAAYLTAFPENDGPPWRYGVPLAAYMSALFRLGYGRDDRGRPNHCPDSPAYQRQRVRYRRPYQSFAGTGESHMVLEPWTVVLPTVSDIEWALDRLTEEHGLDA